MSDILLLPSLTLDLDECLRRVVAQTAALCHVPTVVVLVRDGDDLRVEAGTGPLSPTEVQGTVVEWVSRSGQLLVLTDLAAAPAALQPLVADSQSLAAIPLVWGDTVIGALAVESPRHEAFSLELLAALGQQVTVALQNARLYHAERRRAAQLEAVAQVARAVASTWQPAALYRVIYEQLAALISCDAFILALFDPETRLLHAAFSLQDGMAHEVSAYPPVALQPPGQGMQSEVIHTGRSLIIADLGEQKQVVTYRFGTPGPVTRSAIYVPLRAGEGEQVIGVLQAQSYTVKAYRTTDLPLLEAVADYAAAAIVNARRYQALQESEARLRCIADTLLDLVAQTDRDGVVQYASPSHQVVLGYAPQQWVGTSILDYVHPDSAASAGLLLRRLVETRQVQRMELRFRAAAGRVVWLEVGASVLENDAGELVGFVFGSRDVTARQQAARSR